MCLKARLVKKNRWQVQHVLVLLSQARIRRSGNLYIAYPQDQVTQIAYPAGGSTVVLGRIRARIV